MVKQSFKIAVIPKDLRLPQRSHTLVHVQLIFHMQTCDEPVLPPLHELFEDSCSAISSRPIHMGSDISWHKLEVRP